MTALPGEKTKYKFLRYRGSITQVGRGREEYKKYSNYMYINRQSLSISLIELPREGCGSRITLKQCALSMCVKAYELSSV